MSENEKLEQSKKDSKSAVRGKKDAKKSRPGVFARIGKWFKDMKAELKKVVWPTKKQTFNNTVVVIVCCIVVGIFICLFDWLSGSVVDALLNLFGSFGNG